jgi:hypothetical protein
VYLAFYAGLLTFLAAGLVDAVVRRVMLARRSG